MEGTGRNTLFPLPQLCSHSDSSVSKQIRIDLIENA